MWHCGIMTLMQGIIIFLELHRFPHVQGWSTHPLASSRLQAKVKTGLALGAGRRDGRLAPSVAHQALVLQDNCLLVLAVVACLL